MKLALMIVGGILIVFGLTDLVGSFTGFDLWTDVIGVQLPEIVWKYSAYIEMLAGYFAVKTGYGMSAETSDTQAETV